MIDDHDVMMMMVKMIMMKRSMLGTFFFGFWFCFVSGLVKGEGSLGRKCIRLTSTQGQKLCVSVQNIVSLRVISLHNP